MNKVIYGIISLIVVALGAGVFLASNSSKPVATTTPQTTSNTSSQPASTANTATETPKTEINLPSSGARGLLTYSAKDLAASTTEFNLIFFHAAWCVTCNSVQKNIEAGSIPDNLSIFKLDFDSDEGQALASKYRIPIQYTMVQVKPDGSEITQWINNFGDGIDEITSQLITI